MSGDVKKLPKWAQAEIRRLETNLSRAEQQLAAAAGECDEAPNGIWGVDYIRDDVALPYKCVVFKSEGIRCQIDARGGVAISTSHGYLKMTPEAANCVRVASD